MSSIAKNRSRTNTLILNWDKTADFKNETKPSILNEEKPPFLTWEQRSSFIKRSRSYVNISQIIPGVPKFQLLNRLISRSKNEDETILNKRKLHEKKWNTRRKNPFLNHSIHHRETSSSATFAPQKYSVRKSAIILLVRRWCLRASSSEISSLKKKAFIAKYFIFFWEVTACFAVAMQAWLSTKNFVSWTRRRSTSREASTKAVASDSAVKVAVVFLYLEARLTSPYLWFKKKQIKWFIILDQLMLPNKHNQHQLNIFFCHFFYRSV